MDNSLTLEQRIALTNKEYEGYKKSFPSVRKRLLQ